jgi:hypothetical protein
MFIGTEGMTRMTKRFLPYSVLSLSLGIVPDSTFRFCQQRIDRLRGLSILSSTRQPNESACHHTSLAVITSP